MVYYIEFEQFKPYSMTTYRITPVGFVEATQEEQFQLALDIVVGKAAKLGLSQWKECGMIALWGHVSSAEVA
ncbi:hypothetical protein KJ782_07065 [Patescibacteria group bacterium]|nr:hypothetical protein [Patescibacteria group bacterium]